MQNKKKLNKEELLQIAADSGLLIEGITQGFNGYPEGPGSYGIIGFNNFEEANDFANDFGLNTALFKKRDGWHYWEYVGDIDRPLTSDDYLRDLGDDSEEYIPDNEDFGEKVKVMLDNDEHFNEIRAVIDNEEQFREEYDDLDNERQALIIKDGVNSEVVDREMMSYHEDVWDWAIGVYVPFDYGDSDEE